MITQLPPLEENDRLDARAQAKQYVIRSKGTQPTRDQFSQAEISEYPAWMNLAGAIMLLIVFAASSIITMFRLYIAGHTIAFAATHEDLVAEISGGATPIMAEFMVVTSAIAVYLYFRGRERLLMAVPITVGLAVAFVGNWETTDPDSIWGYLDTIAPPLAVLSTAIIGERILLQTIRQRHANERAYKEALTTWQRVTAQPEADSQYPRFYALAIQEIARRKFGRRTVFKNLTRADWRLYVHRELQANDWFADLDQGEPQVGEEDTKEATPFQSGRATSPATQDHAPV